MKPTFMRAVLILALGCVLAAQGLRAQPGPPGGVAPRRSAVGQAMQSKLKHTHELIDALAVEDFEQLTESARTLAEIGRETLAKVSPDSSYARYSAEFSATADELARRAKMNDLDGVALSYVRLTMNCVDCHRLVRDEHLLDRGR